LRCFLVGSLGCGPLEHHHGRGRQREDTAPVRRPATPV